MQSVDNHIKENQTYYNFSENYENKRNRNKFKNVTVRKRKLLHLTSKDMLKELPSLYIKIPVDENKKIESAKNIFSNIVKRIPPESYKKFKIDYDQSNDINISEINDDSDDAEFTGWNK